jgi:hypothetical protein
MEANREGSTFNNSTSGTEHDDYLIKCSSFYLVGHLNIAQDCRIAGLLRGTFRGYKAAVEEDGVEAVIVLANSVAL